MRYLIDTCVVSDFVKGDLNTLNKIRLLHPKDILISSITMMELEYGLALNTNKRTKIQNILSIFLDSISIIPFTKEDAIASAKVRAFLKEKGTPIGAYDVLLAGAAIENNLTFVTSNTREFERVPYLKIEDWRKEN